MCVWALCSLPQRVEGNSWQLIQVEPAWQADALKASVLRYQEHFMSKKVVMFEYEKETKNSVRFKEVPDEGTAPVVGTLYVQKWFAGSSKTIEITIDKKD